MGPVAAAAALVLGGCSQVPSRGELVHALEASGLPAAKAECAADAVLEELTDDEIIELVERGPAGAPRDDPDSTDDPSDRVRAALAECQQVGVEQTGDVATEETSVSASADDVRSDELNVGDDSEVDASVNTTQPG